MGPEFVLLDDFSMFIIYIYYIYTHMGNKQPRPHKARGDKLYTYKVKKRIKIKKSAHWWGICRGCHVKTMTELDGKYYCRRCIRKTAAVKINDHIFMSENSVNSVNFCKSVS